MLYQKTQWTYERILYWEIEKTIKLSNITKKNIFIVFYKKLIKVAKLFNTK